MTDLTETDSCSTQSPPRSYWRVVLGLPPIAIGALVLLWAMSNREPPAKVAQEELEIPVRVVEAAYMSFVPTAEGFGVVAPAQIWRAVSQVNGRVVAQHNKLRNGEFIAADATLLRVDPTDYELRVAEVRAELAELAARESNIHASLAIEERNLAVAEREYARIVKLAEVGTVAKSDVDVAQRSVLSTRASTQNMRNNLSLIPSQRRALKARLRQAERDLENTVVKAPFDIRVANLNVEQDQVVSAGQVLLEGDSTDRVEITAQVPMSELRRMVAGRQAPTTSRWRVQTDIAELLQWQATVRLDMGDSYAEWNAEFLRITDSVDPDTRTLGVVVGVDGPWSKVIPGVRPPLSKGMYVRVLLRSNTGPKRVTIPRSAIRDQHVFVVDKSNRLRRQQVEVLFHQGDLSVVAGQSLVNRTIVVSDLIPAVDGMLLKPHPDNLLEQLLTKTEHGL